MQEDMDASDGVRGSSTTRAYTPMKDPEPSTSRGTSSSLGKITTRDEGQPSLKRSADTSGDDEDTPIKKPRSTETDHKTTYPTGGLTLSFHGVVYQLKNLAFILLRAMELNKELPFYLSSERLDAGKFDDIVLEHSIDGGDKTALFIQLKHSRDKTKKVKAGDLLEKEDGDFFVPKYFDSWRKINKSEQFNVRKKLILGANFGLDLKDLRRAGIWYKSIDISVKGFEMIATKAETECYKFIPDRGRNRKLYAKLKQMSDVHILARKLAEHVLGNKKLELRDDIFTKYHIALGKQVIDVEKKKFRSNFKKGPKVPPELSNFHQIFCDEFSKLDSTKRQKFEDISIVVSNTFGKPLERLEEAQLNSNFKLPNDEITDDNIAEFLQIFNVVVNLPNEVELGDIIKDEFCAQFSLLNADLIGSTFLMKMIDWFKGNGKKVGEGTYLSYEGGMDFIEEIEDRIENFMSMGVSSVYSEELKKYGIDFEEEIRSESLTNFLYGNEPNGSTQRILILKARTETLLSTLRVYRAVMQHQTEHVKKDSSIFIRLGTLLLPEIGNKVVRAFQSKECHNLLVIECDSASMKQSAGKLWQSLGKAMRDPANEEKRIILITRGDNSLSKQFRGVYTRSEDDDEISFINFTPDSRRNLLKKEIVSLQGKGKRISFGKLLGIEDTRNIGVEKLQSLGKLIDSTNLVDLIRSHDATTLMVGNDLEGLGRIEDYYISRSIYRHVVIRKEILEDKGRADWLVLSGINKNDMPKNLEKFTILDSCNEEEKFANLCEEKKGRSNIHWLKAEPGKYIWKKSSGDISYLLEYREKINNGNCDGRTYALRSEDEFATGDGPVIISDVAGMGKSTLMTYLAGKLKQNESCLLVLRVDLISNVTVFKEVKEQKLEVELRESEQAIEFLVNKLLKRENDFSKRIFKSIIEEKRGVAVIFDGFDEIILSYKDIMINLLHGLAEHGVKKLFVATRPHTNKILEQELNTFSHRLQPFSTSDQKVFLIKFWKKGLNLVDCDQETEKRLSTYAKAILKQVADTSNDPMYNFTGIPLQTRLVAEIFQKASERMQNDFDSCEDFLKSTENQPKLGDKLKLIDLFGQFIDKKFEAFFEKWQVNQADPNVESTYKREKNDFMVRHTKFALDTLFDQAKCEKLLSDSRMRLKYDITEENEYRLDERAGIITEFIDGVPHFGHRTFAEYLAAKYLFDKLKQDSHDAAVRRIYVADIFLENDYVNLRLFMNCLLSDEDSNLPEPKAWQGLLKDVRGVVDETVFHIAAAEGNARLISFFVNCFRGNPKDLKALIDQTDRYEERALCLAIKYRHVEAITLLVRNGRGGVNYRDMREKTPLHAAAAMGEMNVVRFLVEQGANVNSSDDKGNTPLLKAAFRGEIELVKYLVERGANVNSFDAIGNTPLSYSAGEGKIEVVKYLFEQGANFNSADAEGKTPLHTAAYRGEIEVVKYLVERGANVNSSDAKGNTPLHKAASKREIEFVEYLVEGDANGYSPNAGGNKPLYEAAVRGEIEVVNSVTERGASVNSSDAGGNRPLHNAAVKGEIELVKYLIERGADVNSFDAEGNTPLSYSAGEGKIEIVKYLVGRGANVNSSDAKGNAPLHKAVWGGKIEVVKYLVEQGANVNFSDAEGNTPLSYSAGGGEMEVVKYLVEQGANVNSSDAKGNTPLHKAVWGGKIEVMKYLVEQGANVNSSDAEGNTPLSYSAGEGKMEVVKYLVEQGANVNSSDAKGNTPLHKALWGSQIEVVKYLVERGANGYSFDAEGNTPLHEAALRGEIEVVKSLTERGANVNSSDAKGYTPLHKAVLGGEIGVVKYLVERGAKVNSSDAKGNMPLLSAAYRGAIEVVKYLVERGANVNSSDAKGNTPLLSAAHRGEIEVVKYLVERGANVNSSDIKGNTPLSYSAGEGKIEVVKYLFERGANVNSSDAEGTTPLHKAAHRGKIDVVKYLVEQGANAHSSDAEGNTPLHHAACRGEIEFVKYLVEQGVNVHSSDAEGNTPLHKAVGMGKIEVVKYLVERGANVNSSDIKGNTLLHVAAYRKEIEVVKYLLERGANVNSSDIKGNTPLHVAAYRKEIEVVKYLVERGANVNSSFAKGNTPLHRAVRGGNIEVVKYLVERGANVNSSFAKGNTPLHRAVRGGNIEVVKYLVERGANVNSSDARGTTPLHGAACRKEIEVVKYLVERGANVNSPDAKGNTPLHAAAHRKEIEVVKYLVERGANVNSSDAEGNTPLHKTVCMGKIESLKYLFREGPDVNSFDAEGNTPLHSAAYGKEIEVVKYLVERGANVNSSDAEGNTPLLSAAYRNEIEVVKYLVERGANVNSSDAEGNTPLHGAVYRNEIEVVKYLVERGANVNSSDAEGNTPLHDAANRGAIEVVKYLVERGANVDSSDAKGNTPLAYSACEGEIEVMKYLVERGANVNSSDTEGYTPLHDVAYRGEIEVVKYLVERGANVNSSDAEGKTPLSCSAGEGKIDVVKYLVERGANVNPADAKRNTPLHQAAHRGEIKVVKYLVERGANVNSSDAEGNTPLHKAADSGEIEVVKYLTEVWANVNSSKTEGSTPLSYSAGKSKIEVVKYLFEQGANVNSSDAEGNTPLHNAAREGEIEIVKYLVAQGARLDCRNTDCQTPLDQAISANKSDIVAYLREYRA